MNWYKTAKIGEQYLRIKEIPDENIPSFIEYLSSFPDSVQKYLSKRITKGMTLEQLKAIPLEVKETKIPPEMEKIVTQMTENKEEREWLRKLVASGRFKEEDKTKIYLLLKDMQELPKDKQKPIIDFKDDTELAKYLKSFKVNKEIKLPTEGYELLEDYDTDSYNVKLFHITSQEALDAIGVGASWCVLTPAKGGNPVQYKPFDYYCFVIDGEPEVLIHKGSQQMKDSGDAPLRYGPFIKAIEPVVKKYELNKPLAGSQYNYNYDDDDGDPYNDFGKYNASLKNIHEFEKRTGDTEFISKEIKKDPYNILLLDENEWGKYMPIMAEHLKTNKNYDSEAPLLLIDKLNSKILNYLASYLKLHNDPAMERLENMVESWFHLSNSNLTVGRYKKKIPASLRTNKLNDIFNREREYEMEKMKVRILSGYNPLISMRGCPFKEITESPEIWKKLLLRKDVQSPYGSYDHHGNELNNIWEACPFPEVKNDPEIIMAQKENWLKEFQKEEIDVKEWKKCPYPEIKDSPIVTDRIKEQYKNNALDDQGREHDFSEKNGSWKKLFTECPFQDVKQDPDIIRALINKVKAGTGWGSKQHNINFLHNLLGRKYITEELGKTTPKEDSITYEYDVNLIPLKVWEEVAAKVSPDMVPLNLVKNEDGVPLSEDPDFFKKLILNNPTQYTKCKNEKIKNDPEVIETVYDYYKQKVLESPLSNWQRENMMGNIPFFKEIISDEEVQVKSMIAWDRHLVGNPNDFDKCWNRKVTERGEDDKTTEQSLRKNVSYHKRNLLYDPNFEHWKACPFDTVKNDPEVRSKIIEVCKEILTTPFHSPSPHPIQDYPFPEIQNDPETWTMYLTYYGTADRVNQCPFPEIQNDPEIWIPVLLRDVTKWSLCPVEKAKNYPTVKTKTMEYWQNQIEHEIITNPYGITIFQQNIPFKQELMTANKPRIISLMTQKILENLNSAQSPEERKEAKRVAWGLINTFIFKQDLLLNPTIQEELNVPPSEITPKPQTKTPQPKQKKKKDLKMPWYVKKRRITPTLSYPPYHETEDNPFPEDKPIAGSYQEYLQRVQLKKV